ncbi:MAG: hypothetical protein HYX65_02030 [Gemmatimonadetes bacterium]|nr:hypothetical protein [Gemmatimonadota bacterium]
MLGYLDGLCDALLARDTDEVRRLLDDPLAATLPPAVHAEARRGTSGHPPASWIPLQTLRFTHQVAHLEGAAADPAVPMLRAPARTRTSAAA